MVLWLLLLLLLSPLSCNTEQQDLGLWPLVTPLLGVSEPCLKASLEYITLLSEALTSAVPLSAEQKHALQMFDSSGRLDIESRDSVFKFCNIV